MAQLSKSLESEAPALVKRVKGLILFKIDGDGGYDAG